jgi:hypothetical protein
MVLWKPGAAIQQEHVGRPIRHTTQRPRTLDRPASKRPLRLDYRVAPVHMPPASGDPAVSAMTWE